MDPRDPNQPNDRIRRIDPSAPRAPRPAGSRPNTSSRTGPLRSSGKGPPSDARTPTSALRPLPQIPDPTAAQEGGFPIRLDPNSPPGEFNFIVPQAAAAVAPNVGLIAEADGPIPPQLYKAVDELLGFIYGLDQQFENQGRRPKK